jgi:hypothetical protein
MAATSVFLSAMAGQRHGGPPASPFGLGLRLEHWALAYTLGLGMWHG